MGQQRIITTSRSVKGLEILSVGLRGSRLVTTITVMSIEKQSSPLIKERIVSFENLKMPIHVQHHKEYHWQGRSFVGPQN